MADGRIAVDAGRDPYVLDAANIEEPPMGWRGGLRFLGPGVITSAAVVGSGELLTATTLGAEVGFMLLWLVFVSIFVKVWVQVELARWFDRQGRDRRLQRRPTQDRWSRMGPGWCC